MRIFKNSADGVLVLCCADMLRCTGTVPQPSLFIHGQSARSDDLCVQLSVQLQLLKVFQESELSVVFSPAEP